MEQEQEEIEIIDKDRTDKLPKGEAWKRARMLEDKKAAEFMTPEDLYNVALKIGSVRDRCLLVLLYLTGARLEEVVRHRKFVYPKKKVRYARMGKPLTKVKYVPDYSKKPEEILIKPSITKQDITLENKRGSEIILFRMRNLKNKKERVKLVPFKLDTELSHKFKNLVMMYVNNLEEGAELFPFYRRNGERVISETNFNPHFLRKLRLTHLVKYHNFSDQKLKVFAGWTDSRPSKHYIKIGWEDLVDSM